ncbi:MFS general substrate transporter [Westerdykella ornata]|uniref:MFS general substrate transporter n=1 Tax=Westerdykella ornata TaxID=318751 RepID=A0A6A6JL34_WESOR|nr:MFS general substrate transporter [Westerdykella ornata]KAF2276396.1 MFS general substrate transporter [Westerdykella ornata]
MREQEEKDVGVAPSSTGKSALESEDIERQSLCSVSTASPSSLDDAVESINQTLSRNAGLVEEEADKALSHTATNMTSDPRFEVDFDEGGENPKDWSMVRKGLVMAFMSYSTLIVVMYSTSYTSGIPGMEVTFQTSKTPLVLGITTYLIGMALGSVILAPLSEMYGRRPVYIISVFLFIVLVIPAALAQDLATILVVRFFGAIAGAALITNSPGSVTDIVTDEYRALAFSLWSIGPMNGPVVGPLVGGFVFQYMGWRWTNWIVAIAAAPSFLMVLVTKETYGPAILRAKAAKRRKETGDERWHSRYDDRQKFWPMLRENLVRPFSMAVKEPICIFWNVYIALVYGVMYLCFVSYPIVFAELRGWSYGFTGLAYMGIGIGCMITISMEPLIRRMINSHKPDPQTGKPAPESMISVVCIAAIAVPLGEIAFAWTCPPNIHWIFPLLSGVPFGAGNGAIFVYASNYLVHSYGIYAASALAGNAVLRSALGGTLPLAGPKMYETLGPRWSGTMLGLLEVAMIPIPFVFYRYGHKIRARSDLIRRMREDQEKLETKKRRAAEREQRMQEREPVAREEIMVSKEKLDV